MVNSTVLNLLGWAICCLTGLMFVSCVAAIGLAEWTQAGVFLVSGCVSGVIAGALVIGFRGRQDRLNRLHVSTLVLAVWLLLPAVASLPLYASGGFSGLDMAFFEAVSGLTTTGASVIPDVSTLPVTIVFWRSLLQWFGGALTLLTAVLVLAPFGVLSTPFNITIPGYERDDLAKSVWATGRHILPAYALLTLLCMIFLWLTGVPGFDALCLALSALSTGGFMPAAGNISQYDSILSELVLIVFMLLGATSVLAHRAALLRMPGSHADNRESWYLAAVVAVAAVVLTVLLLLSQDFTGGWGVARVGIFRAVSLVTTTGFDNASEVSAGVPFAAILALCSIGGASFSTAGGLKVFRVFSMATQAHRELKRLIHPRGITKAKSAGKPFDVQIMKTIWSMFFVFLIATGVVSVVLGAEGVAVEQAVIAALSSLSNTGPALHMTAFDAAGQSAELYGRMPTFPLMVLSAAMVLGRIEFVIMLSLALFVMMRR